jgi:transposase
MPDCKETRRDLAPLRSARSRRDCPLPTYSPDLNPIENLWSQFKSHLRKQAARTREALDALIWPTLVPSHCQATPQHIQNWFVHAGYS